MPDHRNAKPRSRRPRGFTTQSSGLASEYAREQGWDTNQEQRAQTPSEKQPYDGGRDYDYGAREIGDLAIDTSEAQPEMNGQPKEPGKDNRAGKDA